MGLRRVAEPGAQDIQKPRSPGLQPQGTGRAEALAPHGDGTVEVLAVLGALRLPYGLLLVHDWYFQGVLLRGEGWEGYVSAQWVGAVAGGRDVDHLGVTG